MSLASKYASVAVCLSCLQVQASYLDDIGYTDLLAREPSLTGTGVTVAQVENKENDGDWHTDPLNAGLELSDFTFFDLATPYPTGTSYNDSLSSSHANFVGSMYFSIATGVEAVEAFYSDYYYSASGTNDSIVRASTRTQTNASIVNQSFVFGTVASFVDEDYDDYAALYNVLFCNGLNTNVTPGTVPSPATQYNGITVNVIDRAVSPLADGRSKPDLVAPAQGVLADFSSFTTPVVSACAAILVQAAQREDGGNGTATAAGKLQTLKALLLNGATKTSVWTNSSSQPLDATNGAGVVNINRSHRQLAGQHTATQSLTPESGSNTTPPAGISSRVNSNLGWSFASIVTSQSGNFFNRKYYDGIHNYHFNVSAASVYTLHATLVWNRQFGQSSINNLELRLYNYSSGTLVDQSISAVDNVEHIYIPNLPAGDYVLQVHSYQTGSVASSEDYALAFHFEPHLPIAPSNLSAAPTSSTEIELNWTDNANDESSYSLRRKISGQNSFSDIATLPADTTSYLDSSLTQDTSYDYELYATSIAGNSEVIAASASTYSVLEEWRLDNFGSISNSGNGADDADPEADGIINLVEFALGGDPWSTDRTILPRVQITEVDSSDYLELKYIRPDSDNGLTYSVNTTENLNSWPTDGIGVNSPTIVDNGDGTETWTYRRTSSINNTDAAFMRLDISN